MTDRSSSALLFAEPPDPGIARELGEIHMLVGQFIQHFAALELFIAAWLFKVEASEDQAAEFLTKTRQLDARIKRLIALLNAEGRSDNGAMIETLARIEPYRQLRNMVAHGPFVTGRDGKISLMTWKSQRPTSAVEIRVAVKESWAISEAIGKMYVSRFKDAVRLERVVRAAPPPVE